MKRIIENVSYDTKKSALLGRYENGFPKGDLRWSTEELYKTESGKYFLYGSGGPGSPYSVWDIELNTYIECEAIVPMSLYDVITWAEEYLSNIELKAVLKDIRQEVKRLRMEVPVAQKAASQKLAMREEKSKLAAIQAEEDAKKARRTFIDW